MRLSLPRALLLSSCSLVLCGCVPLPALIKDIETQSLGSYPAEMRAAPGGLYFTGTNGSIGRELAFTDGTEAGTRLVANIASGADSSSPIRVVALGSTVYVCADDGSDGDPFTTNRSLFVSDGTPETLLRLTPARSGSAEPDLLTPLGSRLLFVTNDGTSGKELWATDGSVAGTVLVRDIHASGSANPSLLTPYAGKIYFIANDPTAGTELWQTDGTTAGTTRVVDLYAGTTSSNPSDLMVMNGALYFTAYQVNGRRGLFRSLGTAGTTTLVTDNGDVAFNPDTLLAAGTRLYFLANYSELWFSDGTAGGTAFVQDFPPNSEGIVAYDLIGLGSNVVFKTSDDNQIETLWRSDGTPAGTYVLDTDVTVGSGNVLVIGSQLYYTRGDALNKTTGTVGGTVTVYDQPGFAPSALHDVAGTLYFQGTDSLGNELWKSNGTTAGTLRVVDANPTTGSSYPRDFARAGSYTFFAAQTSATGLELYRSDDTDVGTQLLEIRPGAAAASPTYMTSVGGVVVFQADDGTSGVEPWRSDGTAPGTYRLRDIRAGSASSSPIAFFSTGSVAYFYADDGVNGAELWRTNGTVAGTSLVKDINPGAPGSFPRWFAQLGSLVCFSATTAAAGAELYCTDGTSAGTTLVKDIRPGTSGSGIDLAPVLYNGLLYFGANDGTNGDELWRTDGTLAGTTRVLDMVAGSGSASPARMVAFNGALFFVAFDGARWEMWRTQGSPPTTSMITGAINSSPYSNPGHLTVIGSSLIFTADHPTSKRELWKTDGTPAGTVLVKDINPAAGKSGQIDYVTAVGSIAFFSANDGVTGFELWRTDGTTDATIVLEQTEGYASSFPSRLTELGGRLYLSLVEPLAGEEPFFVDP